MRGDREYNLCPKCGYYREPNNKECPKCGIIFDQVKSELENEKIEKEPKEILSETSRIDISEVNIEISSGNRRNFLYNLNTRAINLFLFVITAIITGILIFIYFLYLSPHE